MNLVMLEAWCQDAITLTLDSEFPLSSDLVEMRRATVKKHSRTKALYEIASDLAEGLSHLRSAERARAQTELIGRYGFGYEFFTDSKLKRIRTILKRGNIRDDAECAELLDVAGDTLQPSNLQYAISALLASYEMKKRAE